MSREIFDLPPYSEIWKDTKKRTPLSKERELLREIMGYIASGVVSITSNDLGDAAETLHEIQELLAQPEQEPVAWLITATSCGNAQDWKFVSLERKAPERLERMFPVFTPLYTSPPTRDEDPVAWLSLSDIQWMNIVNDPEILKLTGGRHNFEDAVSLAVKMTEAKCKANNSNSIPDRKQEPVAWQLVANFVTDGDFLQYTYSKPRDELYEYYRITPLYTAPPKREPLSEEAVGKLLMGGFSTHLMDLVRMVEQAHDIGVDDE